MNNTKKTYSQNLEEISLKDVVLKAQEYIRYFWSKKWSIIIPFLLFVGIFIFRAKSTPSKFWGETKFFLEGGDGGGGGTLGGLLGQIGVGGKKTNPYQIIEVAESKLQMTNVLFKKMGPDSTFIANKILEVYDLPNQWAEDNDEYIGFEFKHGDTEKFTRFENNVFHKLIRRVIDNSNNEALMITDYEEDKGYYFIRVMTAHHDLSMSLSEVSYENLRIFFEDKTRGKLKDTRELLKVKRDSIKNLLDLKINQIADFKDKNRSAIFKTAQVGEVLLESELLGLNAAYLEVLKSYEMADYKYMDQGDYFMLIDRPRAPLGLTFKNWKVEAIKGGILGLFLSIGFLFMIKLYRDIMDS
ncbi:MAG: hypothetical protein AAGA77_00675 [Bacteroidota bacterium]